MHNFKLYRSAAIAIALLAVIVFAVFVYQTSTESHIPPVFSAKDMLSALWQTYKTNNIEPTTNRTFDKSRAYITTSEGEAYTMLRAVWMDDREMFDQSFTWTKDNLKRPNDHLFAWLFGARADGTYGILVSQGGNNTASDADTDIALALVFAYSRWQDESYLAAALPMIGDIWNNEVVLINGKPYLAADNIEKNSGAPTILVNPSYFSPYAYRIFSTLDHSHNWIGLVDSSYDVLDRSMRSPLDKRKSDGLPPDWIRINRNTGAIAAAGEQSLSTNYGFDAMRVPFRIALDAVWYKEKRAAVLLANMSFLKSEWKARGALHSTYAHDGAVVLPDETPAMYGSSLGYFLVADSGDAEAVYRNKLLTLYNPDKDGWREPLGYYDDNLAWFGMALYNNMLDNLYLLNFSQKSAQ